MGHPPVAHSCLVKDIPTTDLANVRRAGVILYTQLRNEIWFGLGIDRLSKDITDFGGSRELRDRNAIETACREFYEESLGIYGIFPYDAVQNLKCVYNKRSLIIFIPVIVNPKTAVRSFKCMVKNTDEISGLIWLTRENFMKMVSMPVVRTMEMLVPMDLRLYTKVRSLLVSSKVGELF